MWSAYGSARVWSKLKGLQLYWDSNYFQANKRESCYTTLQIKKLQNQFSGRRSFFSPYIFILLLTIPIPSLGIDIHWAKCLLTQANFNWYCEIPLNTNTAICSALPVQDGSSCFLGPGSLAQPVAQSCALLTQSRHCLPSRTHCLTPMWYSALLK